MKHINPVSPEDLAAVRAWFEALSRHCRAIDYEGSRPIFAEDMIAFGTFTDFMIGSAELEVDGVTPTGEAVPLLRGGDWQL